MSLTKFTKDMAIISALNDEPNDVGGMTAAELKARYDEGGKALQAYVNDTLTVETDAHLANRKNPHGVDQTQVGLGKVNNTADADKPVSVPQAEALALKADRTSVLEKDNAAVYTPTKDYHPATKRYADEVAGAAVLGQIPDGSITDVKLKNGAVTTEKLKNGAVTTPKLADGAVTEVKLDTVVREKIADKTPAAHKLSHKTGGTDALVPGDIGAAETPKMVTVSLPTAGWVLTAGSYEQTVAVAGILATDTPATCHIEPVGNIDAAAQLLTDEAYGLCFTAGGYAACNTPGQLYCRCPKGGGKPAVNFNINVCMGR